MKYHILRSLSVLAAFGLLAASGCAPSTSTSSGEDFTNADARFSDNVSDIYSMTSVTSAPGFDLKWKDSTGIRALSGFHDTAVLVTFFRTSDPGMPAIARAFDSVRQDLADSVRILLIDGDNTSSAFANAVSFVQAQQVQSQVVVDSAQLAHLRFAGDFADGQLYYTETFVVKPDGTVKSGANVVANLPPAHVGTRLFLDSLARAAYH